MNVDLMLNIVHHEFCLSYIGLIHHYHHWMTIQRHANFHRYHQRQYNDEHPNLMLLQFALSKHKHHLLRHCDHRLNSDQYIEYLLLNDLHYFPFFSILKIFDHNDLSINMYVRRIMSSIYCTRRSSNKYNSAFRFPHFCYFYSYQLVDTMNLL